MDTPAAVAAPPLDESPYHSTPRFLRLGLPLVISHISIMLMQFVDVWFLARYSPRAMAAAGFAGMLFYVVGGFFGGVAGYVGTFVAQYQGEQRPLRIGAAVWQGMYLSLGFGVLMALLAVFTDPIFSRFQHEADLLVDEAAYFRWMCWGGVFLPLSACLTGFFAGRGHNRPILVAQLAGGLTNAVLDALLIFGYAGFPEWGVTGAAVATVAGQGVVVTSLAVLFFRRKHRVAYGTWAMRRWEGSLARRLLRFGLPQGFRTTVEVALWAVFLYLLGVAGESALAASQLAFRVNQLAFMPVVGFSMALTMLVGQAQGAGRTDLAWKAIWRGLAITQVWMTIAAGLFVLAPRWIVGMLLQHDPGASPETLESYRVVGETTVYLLRFVAVYVLLDGVNIVFCSALQGAGDTWWSMKASIAAHIVAIGVFYFLGPRLTAQWTAATVFVCSMALVWTARLFGRKWERMKVTESPETRVANSESRRILTRYLPE